MSTLNASQSNCYQLRAAIINADREYKSLYHSFTLLCAKQDNSHHYAIELLKKRIIELVLEKSQCLNALKAKPFKFGGREDGEDASWRNFWVFPISYTDEQIRDILEAEDCNTDGWPAYHAGHSFARSIYIERGVSRVLVTQSGGLDI